MRQLLSLLSVGIVLTACGADWPQFRGPAETGVASDSSPPSKWTEKEGVKWKISLPEPGSSSPLVVGERVFVTYYSGYGTEVASATVDKLKQHLVCVARLTGKMQWTGKQLFLRSNKFLYCLEGRSGE